MALLVALRGGLPPAGARERETGVQKRQGQEERESGEREADSVRSPSQGSLQGAAWALHAPLPPPPPEGTFGAHNRQKGVTPFLAIMTRPSCTQALRPRKDRSSGEAPSTLRVRGPRRGVWGYKGHIQSVTETIILRISSASSGSGFSRSSMTWVVRILPVLLLRL